MKPNTERAREVSPCGVAAPHECWRVLPNEVKRWCEDCQRAERITALLDEQDAERERLESDYLGEQSNIDIEKVADAMRTQRLVRELQAKAFEAFSVVGDTVVVRLDDAIACVEGEKVVEK